MPQRVHSKTNCPPAPPHPRVRDPAEPPLSPSLDGSVLPRVLPSIARSAGSLALLQPKRSRALSLPCARHCGRIIQKRRGSEHHQKASKCTLAAAALNREAGRESCDPSLPQGAGEGGGGKRALRKRSCGFDELKHSSNVGFEELKHRQSFISAPHACHAVHGWSTGGRRCWVFRKHQSPRIVLLPRSGLQRDILNNPASDNPRPLR